MTLYKPWERAAQRLRSEGKTLARIAAEVGKSIPAVNRAVNPITREKHRLGKLKKNRIAWEAPVRSTLSQVALAAHFGRGTTSIRKRGKKVVLCGEIWERFDYQSGRVAGYRRTS